MSFKKNHLRIVPHLDTSHSLVFDIIERDLLSNTVLKIGRFTDRFFNMDRITFKSKVVSRGHAEIWVENDKFYIKDTKSSSGTFVNRARLSPPSHESKPHQLHNGDIIQLGVDYQGGVEEIYRCVKMKIEINQPAFGKSPSAFGLNSFKSLRNISNAANGSDTVDECCICLYAIAPFQALFVAPCSHSFHFKCCYPLLQNYPGFNCPLCRSYADLNANVAIDTDEVAQMLKSQQIDNNTHNIPSSSANFTIDKVDDISHVHLENLVLSDNDDILS
ncbi:SMAD/FHA domain-containing protein [Mucor ambiguus]|uniref:SMAD/FHA domain-containing protein n=1 Tax=Mucor ambiguus TaxID=91626 RepID=A0A0C9MHA6_9FUNG|nr:SMAD/FHA domain-containing protein [Mucor ambiguus]